MKQVPHTVSFFLNDTLICQRSYSNYRDDPYFPRGDEVIDLDSRKYVTLEVRDVVHPRPEELCVNVREAMVEDVGTRGR